MMTLLLLLLIFFIIIPMIRAGIALYKARKQAREIFEQFRAAASGGGFGEEEHGRNESPKHPEPPVKKKKIDATVGEYVSFEEIPLPPDYDPKTDTMYSRTETVITESRIVDVEWEDIP